MAILEITTEFAGEIGVQPRIVRIVTDDTNATVTTAGYLSSSITMGYTFYPTDLVALYTTDLRSTLYTITFSAGVPTLVAYPSFDVAGDVQAGSSGVAGGFVSYPATAAKGTLQYRAANNAADYAVVVTNASHGQATTYTIPDAGASTANIAVTGTLVSGNFVKASGTAGKLIDLGARLIAGTTGTYAGGGTSNAYTVAGLAVTSVGSAVIRASTNAVSICKAVPGTNTLTITFSADPGASTTVDYIYSTAALT